MLKWTLSWDIDIRCMYKLWWKVLWLCDGMKKIFWGRMRIYLSLMRKGDDDGVRMAMSGVGAKFVCA